MNSSLPSIKASSFGTTSDGRKVTCFRLKNKLGATAAIINFGGTVTSLVMPDRNGKFADIVLGFKTLAEYEQKSPYFGCIVGRFGNRIARGRFKLDGRSYHIPINNPPNSLHGGFLGFDKVVWKATPRESKQGPSLKLEYTSPDGEEGFPGRLSVTATYILTNRNELKLVYRARTDKKTIVNLTHHSYFNLAGHGSGSILDHGAKLYSEKFTPIDQNLIPTGEIRLVKGTPFDFRSPMLIGAKIGQSDEQLRFANGYDHNWIANKPLGQLGLLAKVEESKSGRVLEVHSSEPGFQFYTGNFLDGSLTGKKGVIYSFRNGFCIEPQHYPDSPNHKQFPSVVLNPGEIYKNTIIYRFLIAG